MHAKTFGQYIYIYLCAPLLSQNTHRMAMLIHLTYTIANADVTVIIDHVRLVSHWIKA